MSIDDNLGGKSKQVIWNEAGWGTLGLLTRSERICGVAQALLGGPVRHYFNKRLLKKPGDPGVWQWCGCASALLLLQDAFLSFATLCFLPMTAAACVQASRLFVRVLSSCLADTVCHVALM